MRDENGREIEEKRISSKQVEPIERRGAILQEEQQERAPRTLRRLAAVDHPYRILCPHFSNFLPFQRAHKFLLGDVEPNVATCKSTLVLQRAPCQARFDGYYGSVGA
jgi:hypothetical protein